MREEARQTETCGKWAGALPRCGKAIGDDVCGLATGHAARYCTRSRTLAASGMLPKFEGGPCHLKPGHRDHCESLGSYERKKAHKREKYANDPEKYRENKGRKGPYTPRDPGGYFSRGDLDRLKVWIGCQNEGGCPVGLGGKGMTAGRRPEWFDWDHIDPSTKVRVGSGNGTRMSGQCFSFGRMTEIFATEAIRVLCKPCHATRTKIQQTKSEDQSWREKPDTVDYEIDWREAQPDKAEKRRTRVAQPVAPTGNLRRGQWATVFGDRFPR